MAHVTCTADSWAGCVVVGIWQAVKLWMGMQAADVYAFGVLLWEMAAGQRMFAGMPWAQVMAAITLRHSRPRLPPGRAMPAGLESVVRMCLVASPADRPGFSEVRAAHGPPSLPLKQHTPHVLPSTVLLMSLISRGH